MNERGPDREAALAKYRRAAAGYEAGTRFYARYGRAAARRLGLVPGARVVDVACGTGANLPQLVELVGPHGKVIGVDLSPDMLDVARASVQRHGWKNVLLVQSAVEEAELPTQLDAALFSLTHDVLQSKPAVENVVRHLRSGAGVASFGSKQPQGLGRPLGIVVRRIAAPYVTTFEGFDRPWRQLETHIPDLAVRELLFGCAYLAWGNVPAAQPT